MRRDDAAPLLSTMPQPPLSLSLYIYIYSITYTYMLTIEIFLNRFDMNDFRCCVEMFVCLLYYYH